MLVGAAAQRWNVAAAEITVSDGVVAHLSSRQQAGFGDPGAPGVRAAGEATGVGGARLALAEGRLARARRRTRAATGIGG